MGAHHLLATAHWCLPPGGLHAHWSPDLCAATRGTPLDRLALVVHNAYARGLIKLYVCAFLLFVKFYFIFVPALLRYNWHKTLIKLKV